MQAAEVASMDALSEKLSSLEPVVDVDGRQISLGDLPESQPPEGIPPQTFHDETETDIKVEGRSGVRWEMVAMDEAHCWTLTQKTAALVNATIHVPQNGRLYVCARMSRWQNVHIHGAPSSPRDQRVLIQSEPPGMYHSFPDDSSGSTLCLPHVVRIIRYDTFVCLLYPGRFVELFLLLRSLHPPPVQHGQCGTIAHML